MYKLTSIRPRIDDIGHSRVRTWSASRRVFQRNDSWRRAFSFDSSPVACFTGKPIRREKQATESLYGGSIQATKGKTKHGYGGIVPIFPSFRLSSSRASCNPTKVLVFEARFRPATPNHRYILVYPIDSIVPQIIRIMEKSMRQILQRFRFITTNDPTISW